MEKRIYRRSDRRMALFYRRLDNGQFLKSECKNISEGGLRVILKKPESIERLLQFKLLMPKGHEIIDAVGKIVWLRQDLEVEAGIEILDLGTSYRERIKSLLT